MSKLDDNMIRDSVRNYYAKIANSKDNCCCGASCCSDSSGVSVDSTTLGYSEEEVASLPLGADMGLGCGNPQAIANLKQGDTVLDLGSGGGFDCFLAARQVGAEGKVIGVDMTPEMIFKARQCAEQAGVHNVEFRLGEIENLPIADNSIDVVISNCVINLSPDKTRVFSETFRILRKGGRIAISDIVAIKPLSESFKNDTDTYCGCVSGAALVPEIEKILIETGFCDIAVKIKEESGRIIKQWFPGSGAENYIRSATIEARKL